MVAKQLFKIEAVTSLLGDLTGFRIHSLSSVVSDGRESSLLDSESDKSNFLAGTPGKQRTIQMFTVDDRIAWAVSCGVRPTSLAADSLKCESILNSFRILQ